MEFRAAIFDLDGTLYDKSGLPFRLIVSQLLKGKLSYLKCEREVRNEMKGLYFKDLKGFESAFFSKFKNKDAKEWYYNIYMPDMVRILEKHHSFSHKIADIMLKHHNCGVKTAILSDYGFVHEKCNAIGLDLAMADYLFDAPSLGGLKPCREVFEKACAEMGVAPEECVMYGDRDDTDGAGALAAGMKFVNVKGMLNG